MVASGKRSAATGQGGNELFARRKVRGDKHRRTSIRAPLQGAIIDRIIKPEAARLTALATGYRLSLLRSFLLFSV